MIKKIFLLIFFSILLINLSVFSIDHKENLEERLSPIILRSKYFCYNIHDRYYMIYDPCFYEEGNEQLTFEDVKIIDSPNNNKLDDGSICDLLCANIFCDYIRTYLNEFKN